MIAYGHLFENIGLKQLESMFELSDEEINGSWNQVNKPLAISETDETFLQYLSHNVSACIRTVQEHN